MFLFAADIATDPYSAWGIGGTVAAVIGGLSLGLWRVFNWFGKKIDKYSDPIVEAWIAKVKAEGESSKQMAVMMATLGMNIVEIGKTTGFVQQTTDSNAIELRTLIRYKRVLLRFYKVMSDKIGFNADEVIGELRAILDDNSAEFRALITPPEEKKPKT